MELEGTVLRGRAFDPIEGRVVVEDGEIVSIEETTTDSGDVILPAFVNAHTHLGDSIAKEAGGGLTLEELVAPPDGLKHRLLDAADRAELVEGMTRSLRFMQATGTSTCIEFREGGVPGVEMIEDAASGVDLDPVVLGRETADAMRASDGFGASGANDAEFEHERRATREAGKLFGIHAGEVDSTDIDAALDLDPDFLVHMVHPEPYQLDRVDDSEVPIVLCPRSNVVTDVGLPPAGELAERTTLALGTDNVMTNSPSMFREMAFAAKLLDLPAEDVLRMATVNGAEIAGLNRGVVAEGRDAKLLVLDGDSDNLTGARDVVRAVVRRAGQGDIKRVLL
ncbi:Cytosine/adenosine deaminase [Natronoarchaeum philippinense]|uniref:Cytosine/adenosine deaminase n=1 Tax=Natronoarchaeum philippinense TaxID=558529 RepID=A0A285N514_NATPI|nr:amidohydrolase family protein [Natronoarchaeum philippinense]SNZ04565.1 Cytosine/adenosine deaminase [Natronoarchaeum philippinense]